MVDFSSRKNTRNKKISSKYLLIDGKDDDVFHVIPEKRNDEGESFVEILSKRALLKFAKQMHYEEEK